MLFQVVKVSIKITISNETFYAVIRAFLGQVVNRTRYMLEIEKRNKEE